MPLSKAVIHNCAREAGFDLVGVASAEPFTQEQAIVLERLNKGLMGQLPWYTESRVLRGTNPQEILPGARSIISLAVSYFQYEEPPQEDDTLHGKVARYAWGAGLPQHAAATLSTLCELVGAAVGKDVCIPGLRG